MDPGIICRIGLDHLAGNFRADSLDFRLDEDVVDGDMTAAMEVNPRTDIGNHDGAKQKEDHFLDGGEHVSGSVGFAVEVGAHTKKQIHEGVELGLTDILQGQLADLSADMLQGANHGGCLASQVQALGTAVLGIVFPADPAFGFQLVQMARQGDRLDVHGPGQIDLLHAGQTLQMGQYRLLRPGQAQFLCAQVEFPAQQAGDIMNDETEAVVKILIHRVAYY